MIFAQIRINQCEPFQDNPFQIRDDANMEMLTESIRENGIMEPIIVRRLTDESYEIISGHRRVRACQAAGIESVPAFIHEMSHDEAIICLVDSNLHRDGLLPSEKAFAYKMKLDAMKHQGRTSGQVGQKWTREEVADSESGRTVQRYIRLTNLQKPLLDLVDEGRIALTPAVELSYLPAEEQMALIECYEASMATPSYSQAVRLRKLSDAGQLTLEKVYEVMDELKPNQKEVLRLPMDRYDRYLRRFGTPKEKEAFILKALEYYTRYLERQRDMGR